MSEKGYAMVEGFLLPMNGKSLPPVFRIPVGNFISALVANVDNEKVSDKEFREFVRDTLSIVEGAKP